MGVAEYLIYIPLCYNDGCNIEEEKIQTTYTEILSKFGAITRKKANEGFWIYGGKVYKDKIEIISFVTNDTPSNDAWFKELKAALKKRLRQEDIFLKKIRSIELL